MRPIVVLLPLATLGLMSLAGCSQRKPGSPPAPLPDAPSGSAGCTVHLTGNLSDSLTLPSCGDLSISQRDDRAAEVVLSFHFATASLKTLDTSLSLGPSPSVGSYSSQTPSEWSALGTTDSQCQYVAGSETVPRGSFNLTLSSVDIVDAGVEASADSDAETAADVGTNEETATDAGDSDAETPRSAGIAHGTLELRLSVHAPPATDCGAGDSERIVVEF